VWLRDFVSTLEGLVGRSAVIVDGGDSPSDVPVTFSDSSKAAALLRWKASVGYEEGLASFVSWYRATAVDEYYSAGAWH